MVDKTPQLKTNQGPIRNFTNRFASIVSDGLDLASLQVDLVKNDLGNSRKSIVRIGMLFVLAIGCVLTALPVLADSLAALLASQLFWSESFSKFVVGMVLLFVATIATMLGQITLRKSAQALRPSAIELRANIQWLRDTLSRASKELRE